LLLIHPYHGARDLDAPIMLPEPETDRFTPLNRSDGVKAKTLFGNIQHAASVTGLDIDVGESFHGFPWSQATFRTVHGLHR
jgi:hypothetical protein